MHYANLVFKDQLCRVYVLLSVFLEAFCFLGIFSFFSSIFMRIVLLVLCNIFTGSFLWTLHMKWMKYLGFALWFSLSNMSSGSGCIPRIQKAIKQIFISTLVLAARCTTQLWYLKGLCISLLRILKGCVVLGGLEEEGEALTRTKTTKWLNTMLLMTIVSLS